MLLLHHLFLLPTETPWFTTIFFNRWGGVEFFLSSIGKLCIPLFFFVSGYGLWQTSHRDGHVWKSTFRRLKNIYILYIVTVLASVLLSLLIDKTLILQSWKHAATTLVGINVSINGSWWFFIIYVELLLLTPWAIAFVKKFTWQHLLIGSCFLYLLAPQNGIPYLHTIIKILGLSGLLYGSLPLNLFWFNQLFFFTGFCMAASALFETTLQLSLKTLQTQFSRCTFALLLIAAVLLLRYFLLDISVYLDLLSREGIDIYRYTAISARADFILGPLFIFGLVLLFYQQQLNILTFLGNNSAAIWLIHGSAIAFITRWLKPFHPWSPFIFLGTLAFSLLYALTYSTIYSVLQKNSLSLNDDSKSVQ